MSGSSGITVRSVARDTSASLSAADDQNISSLLIGSAWNSTTITYSFPTSSSVYGTSSASYGDPAPFTGFSALTSQQGSEVRRAFFLVNSYTNLTFTQITETTGTHATIRLANSSSPPTAYAFFPATSVRGGDAFFGGTGRNPVMGNFDSGQATLHEIGHALGLKHGQDFGAYGQMNASRLDIEFSLMNYANYIGSTDGFATATTSAQTYMMYDIAALQYMYGANFNSVGANNTYTWSSTTGTGFINGFSQGTPVDNHIFSTIWTAGATSTYDLSNFSQNQVDDMQPGGWMLFSSPQLADLNARAPSKPSGEIFARGNIYNALQSNGDARSLITNIFTGSGADSVTGNAANNTIHGGAGNDSLNGMAGNDILDGGTGEDLLIGSSGADTFYFASGYAADTVFDFSHAQGDRINLTAFANVHNLTQVMVRSSQVGVDSLTNLGGGDFVTLKNINLAGLVASDFTFIATTTIESSKSTALVQTGNNYFLDLWNGWEGPELRYGGTPFVFGQAAGWRPIGAELMPGGYAVWLRNGSTDEYVMWGTDFAGNFQTSTAVMSGYGYALQSYEGYFQQDLNSDGVIGVRSAALDASGATKLAQIADLYFMYQGNGATGVLLRMGGTNFTAGQNGAWQPIGAEQMPNGYGVWWRNGNTDQYAMWGTDFAGNFQTSTAVVSGYGYTLQSYEGYFQQDLNSDGVIGVRSAALDASGTTKLAQIADLYFMYQGNGATGVLLRLGGMNFTAGQTGAWQPLGAEQLANGTYQVMWKNGALDQYAVWATDSNGNYLSSTAVMAGSSATLKSYETFFQQDFNGNHTVGAGLQMAQMTMIPSGSAGAPGAESSGTANLALLTNYMASTFVTPAGEGTGVVADAQSSGESFLAKPLA